MQVGGATGNDRCIIGTVDIDCDIFLATCTMFVRDSHRVMQVFRFVLVKRLNHGTAVVDRKRIPARHRINRQRSVITFDRRDRIAVFILAEAVFQPCAMVVILSAGLSRNRIDVTGC